MIGYEKQHKRHEMMERKITNREKELLLYQFNLQQREIERQRHLALNGLKVTSRRRPPPLAVPLQLK